jgi:hypothetical protein
MNIAYILLAARFPPPKSSEGATIKTKNDAMGP